MSDLPAAPTQGGPQRVHLGHRQILLVFSGLMLGMFLAALDQTIVSAALPTIAADLGGFDKIVWVVTSYLLTSTVTILMWGKLSDIYGRKVMFQLSIATFLVSSALIGLSPNMLFLVIGRGLQGIGAGGIMSLTFAIVGDILSPRERGKYMGLLGSVFLVSSVVGPLLGGLIVDHLHILGVAPWRWIFYVNLPIGIPALILTQVVLKLPFARQKQRIDYLGAALVSIASSLLILGLIWGGDASPWDGSYNLRWLPGMGEASNVPGLVLDGGQQFLGDWLVTAMLASGLLIGALFVFVETRVENPLLPMSLFRDSVFSISSLVSFVIGAAMFGGFVFLPTYLQISTGVSATYSGLLLLPLIGGLMPMSTASGIIISKTGRYKWWPMVGLPVAAAGMAMLSLLTPDTAKWFVSLGMFLLGAGIGMTMQVMVLAVQNSLPMRQMGVGTAANNFMRSMGSVIGVSLFGVVFNNEIRAALRELAAAGTDPAVVGGILQSSPGKIQQLPPAIRDVVTAHVATGVAHVFLYAIPMVALAFVLVLFLKEVPLRSTRNIGAREGDAVVAAAAGETMPVAPTPPLLPAATQPGRAVSAAPADLRRAPLRAPASHAEIQRAVDALAVPRGAAGPRRQR
ncbi:MAG TPA: MDR family MFS transporter [Candidatus Thermoplasmatota archaeon]|nr:MDR family MFS transporter [Candidatus Thermoplasmatota archaeon]